MVGRGRIGPIPLLGRDGPNGCRDELLGRDIDRFVFHGRACGVFPEMVVVFPTGFGSDRPLYETAATVRADITQDALRAVCAARPFV